MLPKDTELQIKAHEYVELLIWVSENWQEIIRFYINHAILKKPLKES